MGAGPGGQAPDEDLGIEDYEALAEFRFQIRRFLRFSEQAARDAGLEPQQHQLLLAIKGQQDGEEASVGALAERLQLQPHSTLELIERLIEREMVERRRDPHDRRRVLVRLTPQGEAALRHLTMHHWQELRTTGPALVRALVALLRRDGAKGDGWRTHCTEPAE